MLKFISKILLGFWGWKIVGRVPADVKKAVLIVAPHTSNLDFFIGRLAFFILEVKVKFLIKKESFKFPVKGLLKFWGGIPIDRGSRSDHVGQVASLFDNYDSLVVTITPEGTRKLSRKWKKGFYYIALKANVPIIFGFLDYDNKRGGVNSVFYPSGDYEKDLKEIEKFYKTLSARYPENYNLSPENYKKSE